MEMPPPLNSYVKLETKADHEEDVDIDFSSEDEKNSAGGLSNKAKAQSASEYKSV